MPSSRPRSRGDETAAVGRLGAAEPTLALAAAVLAALAAGLVLELWRAPLAVPWVYSGDGNFYASVVKGILEHGWHYTNPDLGAPSGQQLYDFPIVSGENFQALLVRLLGLVSSDWATVMNVYFLLTFPLAAMTSFVVLRWLGTAPAPALVCATLFALLPYHFARGQNELFISGYYAVPFGAYLVLTILAGEPLFTRARGRRGLLSYCSRRSLATVGMCLAVVLASGSFYYAAFTILLAAGATGLALILGRGRGAVASGAVVIAIVGAGVVASLVPTIAYQLAHGRNEAVTHRGVNESEIFALKLTQLVLPIEDHRIGALARRSSRYTDTAPFGELGRAVHLGLVASLGFAWLLVVALAGATSRRGWRPGAPYRHAAVATLLALLIGTVGGLSALVAAVVTPQFRAWNRISIFIGFFALLAVGLALSALGERWRRGGARIAFTGLLAAVLVIGVLDQTSSRNVPAYDAIRRAYRSDARLVGEIERRLPRGSDVFQLPYVPFPEAGLTGRVGDYDLALPYLHSRELHWSFGAIKGRPEDSQAGLAGKPIAVVLPAVEAAGFEGLYIDRFGYPDRAAGIEAEISALLEGAKPLVSEDGRLSFFELRD